MDSDIECAGGSRVLGKAVWWRAQEEDRRPIYGYPLPFLPMLRRAVAHATKATTRTNAWTNATTIASSSRTVASSSSSPPPSSPLIAATKVFAAANALGLGISLATGSHVHLDLIGTGAFAVVALATAGPSTTATISAFCVGLWGTRLAGFLFYRALQTGHDARLDDLLSTPSGATVFWATSFVWGVVCSLPHTLGAGVAAPRPLGLAGAAGLVLFAFGFALETTADVQKYLFKRDTANAGKFCGTGVWAFSQHPNYAGNIMLWAGILLVNSPALLSSSPLRFLAALASPAFMLALFYGQSSGAMANTVELANGRYGQDPAYQEYVKTVALIFPGGVEQWWRSR